MREVSQFIRVQERLLTQLQQILEELDAPSTSELVREIRKLTGAAAVEDFAQVTTSVQEAIRALKLSEAAARDQFLKSHDDVAVEGMPNLPPALMRFLAERSEYDGFAYDVRQDEVRGWVIAWKEHTEDGILRGFGQFYERPYAWLEE